MCQREKADELPTVVKRFAFSLANSDSTLSPSTPSVQAFDGRHGDTSTNIFFLSIIFCISCKYLLSRGSILFSEQTQKKNAKVDLRYLGLLKNGNYDENESINIKGETFKGKAVRFYWISGVGTPLQADLEFACLCQIFYA